MSRKTVLFLYTEFSSYLECCINELLNSSTIDFHIVRYPVNKEAPFNFNNLKFSCYCRSEFKSKKELLNFKNLMQKKRYLIYFHLVQVEMDTY